MTSFTVISDTHGKASDRLEELLPVINSGDFLVHLGDGVNDLDDFADRITCDV